VTYPLEPLIHIESPARSCSEPEPRTAGSWSYPVVITAGLAARPVRPKAGEIDPWTLSVDYHLMSNATLSRPRKSAGTLLVS
jgi:hypothetical protein